MVCELLCTAGAAVLGTDISSGLSCEKYRMLTFRLAQTHFYKRSGLNSTLPKRKRMLKAASIRWCYRILFSSQSSKYGKTKLIDIKKKNNQLRAENVCVKTANFTFINNLDDFEFDFQPDINRKEMLELGNLGFIDRKKIFYLSAVMVVYTISFARLLMHFIILFKHSLISSFVLGIG